MYVEILLFGVATCVLPIFSFIGKFSSKNCKMVFLMNFIAYTSLGIYFTIMSLLSCCYDPTADILASFLFSVISGNILYYSVNQKRHTASIVIYAIIFGASFIFQFRSGMLIAGQMGDDQSSNIIEVLFTAILTNPLVIVSAALAVVGGLAKMVTENKAAMTIGDILIIWFPAFIWILVLLTVIPVPKELVTAFFNNEWFAYLIFLITYGVIMLAISSIMQVFQAVRST